MASSDKIHLPLRWRWKAYPQAGTDDARGQNYGG
jgi:hypothetical protein